MQTTSNNDEYPRMRCPMPIYQAYKLGQALRLAGYSPEEVGEYLIDLGYSPFGITAGRIQRGYESIED